MIGLLLVLVSCATGSLPVDDGSGSDASIPVADSSTEDSSAMGATADGTVTVVYATRHFEKEADGFDPHLTPEGLERAELLREHLTEVPLSGVFATEYFRTIETVQPTAAGKSNKQRFSQLHPV